MNRTRTVTVFGASLAALTALSLTPAAASAAGPPQAATAFATAIVTPKDGGSVSGFGITATFAPGAVTTDRMIILGNWPNGLDVTPPSGTAVKTFGLQECDVHGANCTSELGNFPNSPAGSEKIKGVDVPFTAFQNLPDAMTGNTNFGSAADKKVTITTQTGADKVYVYNANNSTTASAYPKLLPSTSDGTSLTFQTFQPIVWTLTAPTA